MSKQHQPFEIVINTQYDYLLLEVIGAYSLEAAINMFQLAIDMALQHQRSTLLIDVHQVTGNIPFMDRFYYAETTADYYSHHAIGKLSKIAVIGMAPIVDASRFGETVAVNRGINVKVFNDLTEAVEWLA